MLSSSIATLLNSYGHLLDLGFEIALSHRYVENMLILPGKTNIAIHGPHLYNVGMSTATHLQDFYFQFV